MPEVPYFKCYRSEVAKELLAANMNAFLLLWQIAYRAKRTNSFCRYNLAIGEAFLGDFKNIGLTEGKYRYAKKFLAKHRFATFRTTNDGTIAKLTNFEVFDPNLEDSNGQHNTPATNQRRTNNEPTTTNKNDKNENNDKNEKGNSSVKETSWHWEKQLNAVKDELKEIENTACYDAMGSIISWGATGDRERKKALKDKEKELKAKLTGVP